MSKFSDIVDDVFREEFEKQDRKAAGWLLYHNDRKKEMEERKQEVRDGSLRGVSYTHEPKGATNKINDPVVATVIKLSDFKEEKSIKLIDDITKRLTLEEQVLLKLKQKYRHRRGGRGRIGAMTLIQQEYAEQMARLTGEDEEDVWVSQSTLKRMWNDIIEMTVRSALKRNLL